MATGGVSPHEDENGGNDIVGLAQASAQLVPEWTIDCSDSWGKVVQEHMEGRRPDDYTMVTCKGDNFDLFGHNNKAPSPECFPLRFFTNFMRPMFQPIMPDFESVSSTAVVTGAVWSQVQAPQELSTQSSRPASSNAPSADVLGSGVETEAQCKVPVRAIPVRRQRDFQIPVSQEGVRVVRAPMKRTRRGVVSSLAADDSEWTPPGDRHAGNDTAESSEAPVGDAVADDQVEHSQDQPTQPSPGRMQNDNFGFSFGDAHKKRDRVGKTSDPIEEPLEQVRAAKDRQSLEKALHHEHLFAGYKNEKEAYETTMKRLQDIVAKKRTHRSLAEDQEFSLRSLVPVPLAKGIAAIAVKEGWHPECLYQELKVCASFPEHPATRLKVRKTNLHKRSCGIPCLRAADASARKTSLDQYGTSLLTETKNLPDPIFKKRQFIASDATVRGIRNAIVATDAAAIISSEVNTTYKTPNSEDAQGLHFIPRPLMCKDFTCEEDDSMTGKGGTHILVYRFLHKVCGQLEAVEFVWSPATHGFQKRIDITISPSHPKCDDEQECGTSKATVEQFFEFLFREADPNVVEKCCDGFALALYKAVCQAIDDFIHTPERQKLTRWAKFKLEYKEC